MLNPRLNTARGSLMLLIGAVLPLLFIGLSISMEFQQIGQARSAAQELVDAAASIGAANLPYAELAQRQIQNFFSFNGVETNGPTTHITTDIEPTKVTVGMRTSTPAQFSTMFNSEQRWNITATATAHLNPRHVVLFFDTSSYLAPPVLTNNRFNDDPWGFEYWPASRFFSNSDRAPHHPTLPAGLVPSQGYETTVFPRIQTQQCYNPAFSALKEATIRMYDYFSAFPSNRVAVLTGPTDISNRPVVAIHPMSAGGFTSPNRPEGSFFFRRTRYARDEHCLALAEFAETREADGISPSQGSYGFPPRSGALPALIRFSPRPQSLTTTTIDSGKKYYTIPSYNLHHLSVREIIWSRAIATEYESNYVPTPRKANISTILAAVKSQLFAGTTDQSALKLGASPSLIAYILLGDLPHQSGDRLLSSEWKGGANVTTVDLNVRDALRDGVRDIHEKAEAMGIESVSIIIAWFKHVGNYPPDGSTIPEYSCPDQGDDQEIQKCEPYIRDGERFGTILNNISNRYPRVKLVQYQVPDTAAMAHEFGAYASLIGKSSMVTR